ncbi:RNA polymerase sigma factor [Chitinophaga skermanii]|uniref:RNA polymerase sigma factor n=1 Tax=Chitinophaga skermanii TaxID=331697 RepID=UPI0011E5A829|nr:sigma-70 family RNA polymerase sigma factor [Chitinophaga skermanii]
MNQLLAGQPLAQQLAYDKYAAALYSLVLQIVGDTDTANNIIVNLFSYLFTHVQEFQSSGYNTLFSWLYRKARELAVNHSLSITSNSSQATSLTRQNLGAIQRFASTLNEAEQLVFKLSYFNGLPLSAIAKLMGKEEKEIDLILKSAMINFRKYISTHWI